MSNLFTYKNFQLEYLSFGSGDSPLLAFHGFDRPADDYKIFQDSLGKKFNVLAFHLFHHGKSLYPSDRIDQNTLTKKELKDIFTAFFKRNKINRFSLSGYSMGGKVALVLYELFPDKTDHIYLFAPDGIKLSFWYQFSSRTFIGNKLYKTVLQKPNNFFQLVNFLKSTRVITQKFHKFIHYHMEDHRKRKLIYDVWMTYRLINPDIPKIQQYVDRYDTDIQLFFGKYDRVIPPKFGEKFISGIHNKDKVNLHVLESGHLLLSEATNNYLKKVLKKKVD